MTREVVDHALQYAARWYIYGEAQAEYSVTTPCTWWDHFKHEKRHWWIIRKFFEKARHNKIEIETGHLYPSLAIEGAVKYIKVMKNGRTQKLIKEHADLTQKLLKVFDEYLNMATHPEVEGEQIRMLFRQEFAPLAFELRKVKGDLYDTNKDRPS